MTALAVIAGLELALIGLLIIDRRKQGRDYIDLVDRLCQRIQAPHAAILEHDEKARGRTEQYAPPALEPDDDDGYWMSREKLAEYAMNAETSGRTSD